MLAALAKLSTSVLLRACADSRSFSILFAASLKGIQVMRARLTTGLPGVLLRGALFLTLAFPLSATAKKWALIVPGASKLQQVSLADITKLCRGEKQSWPDGQSFTLYMLDPESPEMRGPVRKLFGVSPTEIRPLVAKLNGSRSFIKIVDHDEDVLRGVSATPGAVGIVDVYAINSSVKVIRIDDLLPFDPGYALKGD
jgi:hypothetical protein